MNHQPDGSPSRAPHDSPPALPGHALPWLPPRPVTDGNWELAQASPFAAGAPPRPRVWPILLVLIASFFIYIAVSMLALVLAGAAVHGSLDASFLRDAGRLAAVTASPLGMAITVVIPQLALALPAVVAAAASPVPLRERLGLTRGHWPIWLWFTAAVAMPLIGLISSAVVGSLLGESESLDEMASAFRNLGQGGFLIPLALMIGLTPGVCEELVFRGYMQTRLNRAWGAPAGILCSSAVFAAFHMDLVHSVAVMSLGIYLGWIAWASGSILPAMFAHFLNNFLSVLAVVLLPQSVTDGVTSGTVDELPVTAAVVLGSTMLVSGFCLILTLWHARRLRSASLRRRNHEQILDDGRILARQPNQD